jgi:hypothetical protein
MLVACRVIFDRGVVAIAVVEVDKNATAAVAINTTTTLQMFLEKCIQQGHV